MPACFNTNAEKKGMIYYRLPGEKKAPKGD
jgi:hypothetical protein